MNYAVTQVSQLQSVGFIYPQRQGIDNFHHRQRNAFTTDQQLIANHLSLFRLGADRLHQASWALLLNNLLNVFEDGLYKDDSFNLLGRVGLHSILNC